MPHDLRGHGEEPGPPRNLPTDDTGMLGATALRVLQHPDADTPPPPDTRSAAARGRCNEVEQGEVWPSLLDRPSIALCTRHFRHGFGLSVPAGVSGGSPTNVARSTTFSSPLLTALWTWPGISTKTSPSL